MDGVGGRRATGTEEDGGVGGRWAGETCDGTKVQAKRQAVR